MIEELEKIEWLGWLLIFDNVQDVELITRYIPDRGGCAFITSRLSRVWTSLDATEIAINYFQPEDVRSNFIIDWSADGAAIVGVHSSADNDW